MENLKHKLLSLGIFIDNEYLDFYCTLIKDNLNTAKCANLTEKHHIIQRAYYKENCLAIDNSAENLVYLSHSNHCLAHYYLCLCTSGKFKYLNEYALIKMVNIKNRFEFNLTDFLVKADYYNSLHEDFKLQQSIIAKERFKNGGTNKGKHSYTNGQQVVYRETCPDGFWPGGNNSGKAMSAETKLKMHEAAIKRNTKDYRQKLSAAATGKPGTVINRKWITNGIEEKLVDLSLYNILDPGWYIGRSNKSKFNNIKIHQDYLKKREKQNGKN